MNATAAPFSQVVEILLVEDNEGDIRLTREALKEGRIRNRLNVVSDGEQALRFLRREQEFAGMPRPDLVLLDLNLPRLDGREVLAAIKKDPDLKQIPVVVLTSSRADEDLLKAYDSHANCYISKPVGFEDFMQVIRSIENFWLTIVVLPPKD
ncbi:MAG: response regulator [Dokdonella sp.]|jgi:chemotaxis family two-component system response regulator Rcp1|uniref:response regulator n=1 Tax=Dokdonella sp. TaxID=2291710 RepID=UPI001B74AB6B|nr:response regulator [Dokdonella sp.]MCC6441375.1 response regulator [Rhodanobacteraceae bacterium]MBK8122096.1 response regulator [Dokdonella sp.]MBP6325529.1 response regulator [Dokdonella sp.]MBP6328343.1 response regulator [Dokdonella sp.]HQV47787.1 response regulator [Dokdonella sp.]